MHKTNAIRCKVVESIQELLDVVALRSICFTEEDNLPHSISCDGNDFAAMHFICYYGEEPIASARVRAFGDFVKIERSCLRKNYRNTPALRLMVDFIHQHLARKGFKLAVTHAEEKYAAVWCRLFKYKVNKEKSPFKVANREKNYLELVRHLEILENAIGANSDVYVLSRIEGRWDAPSELG